MKIDNQLCYKFLNFIVEEAGRHLRDGEVTDDELLQFAIELDGFKDKVESSDLDNYLKENIREFTLDYSMDQIQRNTWLSSIRSTLFGKVGQLYNCRRQYNIQTTLEDIRSRANSLANYMKLNY